MTVSDEADRFEEDVISGRLQERTNTALDGIIRLAALKMKKKGYSGQANKLIHEWENDWDWGRGIWSRGMGDHRPFSQWIDEKYHMWLFILGEQMVHALRLDDIETINHGIVVIFACHKLQVEEGGPIYVTDYFDHLQPFLGVVAYWGSFWTCVGFTWGAGLIGMICSPIAYATEFLVENVVAPRITPWCYDKSCN